MATWRKFHKSQNIKRSGQVSDRDVHGSVEVDVVTEDEEEKEIKENPVSRWKQGHREDAEE